MILYPRQLPSDPKTFVLSFRPFFGKGQVIETFRGGCIYQPAVNPTIEKLCAGAWVRVLFCPVVSFVCACSSSHRFTFLERGQSADSIARYSASSGECAPVLLFYYLSNNRTSPPTSISYSPHTSHKNVVLTRPFLRRYDNRPPSAVGS